jgi:hypothetical protein
MAVVGSLAACTPAETATTGDGPSTTRAGHALTAAPTDCANQADVLVQDTPPWGQLLGDSPAWMYVGDALDASTGALHVRARRLDHGWQMKALWLLPASASTVVTVTGTNASTGGTMWFEPALSRAGEEMTLDPAHPGAVPTGHRWLEFPSAMSFPAAGCYTLNAHGADGEWSTTFGLGR